MEKQQSEALCLNHMRWNKNRQNENHLRRTLHTKRKRERERDQRQSRERPFCNRHYQYKRKSAEYDNKTTRNTRGCNRVQACRKGKREKGALKTNERRAIRKELGRNEASIFLRGPNLRAVLCCSVPRDYAQQAAREVASRQVLWHCWVSATALQPIPPRVGVFSLFLTLSLAASRRGKSIPPEKGSRTIERDIGYESVRRYCGVGELLSHALISRLVLTVSKAGHAATDTHTHIFACTECSDGIFCAW